MTCRISRSSDLPLTAAALVCLFAYLLACLLLPYQDDDSKEYHKEMSKNVNERIQKSMEELREKHAAGTNEVDDPDRAPTGAAYREVARIEAERSRAQRSAVAPTDFSSC